MEEKNIVSFVSGEIDMLEFKPLFLVFPQLHWMTLSYCTAPTTCTSDLYFALGMVFVIRNWLGIISMAFGFALCNCYPQNKCVIDEYHNLFRLVGSHRIRLC